MTLNGSEDSGISNALMNREHCFFLRYFWDDGKENGPLFLRSQVEIMLLNDRFRVPSLQSGIANAPVKCHVVGNEAVPGFVVRELEMLSSPSHETIKVGGNDGLVIESLKPCRE